MSHASSSPSRAPRVKTAAFSHVGGLVEQTLDGRYRLEDILGSGGMGTVYRARHVAIGKPFAVKILAQEFANEETFRVRFLREAQAISQIGHQNVVEVTDFGVTPSGSLYLVMEILDGEVLADILDRDGALGWAKTKPLILQVCHALQAAHDKGILHRDIKPENCMRLTRAGNANFVKVLDFGLAKMLVSEPGIETSLSTIGGVMGTPEYMSPERIRGESLDARSDLYSVGVLCYELLTGCVPFSGEHYTQVLDQQLNAEPVPPRQVAPHVDIGPELEAVVLRALDKDPQRRFASVAELAAAFEQADAPREGDEPVDEKGAASRERTYKIIIFALLGLVFVLCGVVAALALDVL